MKILVLGDIHGNLEIAKEIIKDESPDYVLCTGDLETYTDFEAPFFFVYGNHEDFDKIEKMKKEEVQQNLNLICPGDVVSFENLRIAGLWGNYSRKRYEMERKNLHGDRRRHFVEEDVEKCKNLKNIDIFLSHEAPSGIGVKKDEKDLGAEPVGEILRTLKPKYWFFGHVHMDFRKGLEETEVIGLNYPSKSYIVLSGEKGKIKVSRKTGPRSNI